MVETTASKPDVSPAYVGSTFEDLGERVFVLQVGFEDLDTTLFEPLKDIRSRMAFALQGSNRSKFGFAVDKSIENCTSDVTRSTDDNDVLESRHSD